MKLRNNILALAAALSIPAPLTADVFDDAVKEIVANNLSLKSSREMKLSELETLKSENNLENPEVEFEHLWGPVDAGNRWSIGVSQSFEWPGVYGARKKVWKAASRAMDYLSVRERFDKVLDIRTTLIDIVNMKRNLAALSEVERTIVELLEKQQKGARLGEVSVLDINRLRIERVGVASRVDDVRASLASLESSLVALNGGRDCSGLIERLGTAYPNEKILSEEEYADLIMKNDPDIAVSNSLAEAAREKVKAVRMGGFPGFSLGYVHSFEDNTHFNGFSVSVSLPFFANRHKKKSAEAELRAVEIEGLEKMATRKAVSTGARNEALALKKSVEQYKEAVEDEDNMRLLKKAYEGGQISVTDYLQQMLYFMEAKLTYNENLYRYNMALARLNRYNTSY